jgi:hypothetical protein
MAQRGEASPDDADALALTFAQPVAPRQEIRKSSPMKQQFRVYAPTGESKARRIARPDRAEASPAQGNAAAGGSPYQPGKLSIQEQAGLVDGF